MHIDAFPKRCAETSIEHFFSQTFRFFTARLGKLCEMCGICFLYSFLYEYHLVNLFLKSCSLPTHLEREIVELLLREEEQQQQQQQLEEQQQQQLGQQQQQQDEKVSQVCSIGIISVRVKSPCVFFEVHYWIRPIFPVIFRIEPSFDTNLKFAGQVHFSFCRPTLIK